MKQLLRCVSLKGSNLCLLKMAHIHEKCTRSLALASFDSNINSFEALNGIRYIISISSFFRWGIQRQTPENSFLEDVENRRRPWRLKRQ